MDLAAHPEDCQVLPAEGASAIEDDSVGAPQDAPVLEDPDESDDDETDEESVDDDLPIVVNQDHGEPLFPTLDLAPAGFLETPIFKVGLKPSVAVILLTNGVQTVEDLVGKTADEMLRWNQLSRAALENITNVIGRNLEEPMALGQPVPFCWVQYVFHDPACADFRPILQKYKISSDADYLEAESQIEPFHQRISVGQLRFKILTEFREPADIGDPGFIASCCPPWTRSRKVQDLVMPNGAREGLMRNQIQTVDNLCGLDPQTIRGWSGFGTVKMKDVCIWVAKAISDGPTDPESLRRRFADRAVRDLILESQADLKRFAPEILSDGEIECLSGGVSGKTLERMGKEMGLTRERVRQMQSNAAEVLRKRLFWMDRLKEKIGSVFCGADSPVTLHGLSARDPFFDGVSQGELRDWFVWILENCLTPSVHLISSEDFPEEILCAIKKSDWDSTVKRGRQFLREREILPTLKERPQLEEALSGLLPESANELRRHFLDLFFQGRKGGCEIIDLLDKSPTPLTCEQIAAALGWTGSKALSRIGGLSDLFRFERSTYGTRRHLGLSDEQLRGLAQACAEIALQHGGRQWSCAEFAKVLAEGGLPEGVTREILTPDLLNNSLLLYGREFGMNDQARMSWRMGAGERVQILPECLRLLREHGKLTIKDLGRRLEEKRGLGATFQIQTYREDGLTMIRLDTDTMGILERHGGELANPSAREDLTAAVLEHLEKSQKGVHLRELGSIPAAARLLACGLDPVLLSEVCRLSPAIALGEGSYLYLTAWGQERRLSIIGAVRNVAARVTEPITSEELKLRVENEIARALTLSEIKSAAGRSGLRCCRKTQLWLPRNNVMHPPMIQQLSQLIASLRGWFDNHAKPALRKTEKTGQIEDYDKQLRAIEQQKENVSDLFPICVLGQARVGKSTLLNTLVAETDIVVPSGGGDGPLTANALRVRYGAEKKFSVRYHGKQVINQTRFTLEAKLRRDAERANNAAQETRPDGEIQPQLEKEMVEYEKDFDRGSDEDKNTATNEAVRRARLLVTGSQGDSPEAGRTLSYLIDALLNIQGLESKHGSVLLSEDLERIREVQSAIEQGSRGVSRTFINTNHQKFYIQLKLHACGFLAPLIDDMQIEWPSEMLRDSVELVDLPGTGIHNDLYESVTSKFLREKAKAILLVTDSGGLRQNDAELLRDSGFLNRLLHASDDPGADPVALMVAVVQVDNIAKANYQYDKQQNGTAQMKKAEHFARVVESLKKSTASQLKSYLTEVWQSADADLQRDKQEIIDRLSANVQIFPLSAPQYRLLKKTDDDDEERAFLPDLDSTQVPALRQAIVDVARTSLREKEARFTGSVGRFFGQVRARLSVAREQLSDDSRAENERAEIERRLADFMKPKREEFLQRQAAFRNYLRETVPTLIEAKVKSAALVAQKELHAYLRTLETANWATLRAAVRRSGTFFGSRHIQLPHDFALRFEEPVAQVWSAGVLREIRKVTGSFAQYQETLLEEVLRWAKASNVTRSNALLEALLNEVQQQRQQLNAVGKEAVDDLRAQVQRELVRRIEGPIRRGCEEFIDERKDVGPGVKLRILEMFRDLAETVIEAATEPATRLLTDRFREVELEIVAAFSKHANPLEDAAAALLKRFDTQLEKKSEKASEALGLVEAAFKALPPELTEACP
jgi:hypothetical protein